MTTQDVTIDLRALLSRPQHLYKAALGMAVSLMRGQVTAPSGRVLAGDLSESWGAPRAALPAPVLPTPDHETHAEPHQDRRESGATSPDLILRLAAVLSIGLLTYLAVIRPAPAGRYFHPMPLAQMAQAAPGDPIVPTHVVTYGTVRLVRQEADGDLHVRLCAPDDPGVCIVLECIPELPCKAPRYGDHVTAQGISRWDTAHRWAEIHPVLSLEVDK